jgi:ATP-dependent helicase/nuclease subunit A
VTRAEALAEAEAAMATPGAAPAFAAEALAEVPVSVRLAGRRVSGRIDRLAAGERELFALDFKTDAAPPAPGAAPEPYLRQLAAYREALRALYPGRAPRLALLWTALPRLDVVPDAALDAALARLVAEEDGDAGGGAPGGPRSPV